MSKYVLRPEHFRLDDPSFTPVGHRLKVIRDWRWAWLRKRTVSVPIYRDRVTEISFTEDLGGCEVER